MTLAIRAFPTEETARSRRPRGWVVIAVLAGVLLAVAAGYSFMPMRVRAVDASGMRYFTRAEVVRLANVVPGSLVGRAEARALEARLSAHPAFASVRVSRGLDGTLSVRVAEREPVAWLPAFGCAVSSDGRLLTHMSVRRPEWTGLAGFEARNGQVADLSALAEATGACELTREFSARGGIWRRLPGNPGGWEWTVDGRRVVFSSPISEDEIKRLQRFQREFPREWGRARQLDLRFADRVVMKR